jgi:hypothetical protein
MNAQYYYLNSSLYTKRDTGEAVMQLTCCDSDGNVTQFFADAEKYVIGLELFDIIDVSFNLVRYGKGMGQKLLSYVKVVDEEEELSK